MRYVYILRSVKYPEEVYVGSATNILIRLKEHNRSNCRHTSKFIPWEIVYFEKYENDHDAIQRERQIKKWSRKKKVALINDDIQGLRRLSKRRVF